MIAKQMPRSSPALTLHNLPLPASACDRKGVDDAFRNTVGAIGQNTHGHPGALSGGTQDNGSQQPVRMGDRGS